MKETVFHGGKGNKCCGSYYNHRHWFRCGACKRKCCYCFGGDSALKSPVDLCDDCYACAMEQASIESIDVEQEAESDAARERERNRVKAIIREHDRQARECRTWLASI